MFRVYVPKRILHLQVKIRLCIQTCFTLTVENMANCSQTCFGRKSSYFKVWPEQTRTFLLTEKKKKKRIVVKLSVALSPTLTIQNNNTKSLKVYTYIVI